MRKWIWYFLLFLLAAAAVAAWFAWDYYQRIYAPNTNISEPVFIHIPSDASMDDLYIMLQEGEYLEDFSSFAWLAGQMSFKQVRPGRYLINPGENNLDLIRRLRAGQQEPVRLILHNKRRIEDVAGTLGEVFELDSIDFLNYFRSPAAREQSGYEPRQMMQIFIPNTYFVNWNTNPEALVSRMMREHAGFWNSERLERAEQLGYSPEEIYIIASIVQAETNYVPEMPTIAGVYLNRLRRGWNLEADPTVVFAWNDFTITRVLRRHLEIDSPYNTYRNPGLPPGPIYMPSIQAIDATLNPQQHDYMFFCAKPDLSGQHAFSKTLSGHLQNAAAYHRFLNSLPRN